MSINEDEITQANGKLHHLFPQPAETDSGTTGFAQAPGQAEPASTPEIIGNTEDAVSTPVDNPVDTGVRRRPVRATIRKAHGVATHRHTRTAARHCLYLMAGFRRAARNFRDSRTTASYDQAIRGARAVSDHAMALEWDERRSKFLHERHQRHMERVRAAKHRAIATGIGAGLTVAGLFALGVTLAITNKDEHDVFGPLKGLFDTIRWCVGAFDDLWLPGVLGLSVIALVEAWRLGRAKAELPVWLMTPEQREAHGGDPITPSVLVTGLRDLGLTGDALPDPRRRLRHRGRRDAPDRHLDRRDPGQAAEARGERRTPQARTVHHDPAAAAHGPAVDRRLRGAR
jgi:S-DNA-T family DNA segregation ATPase FtsK/SpoIIIE